MQFAELALPELAERESLWTRYRLRRKRQRLLARALIKRRELRSVRVLSDALTSARLPCFSTIRNEAARLPYFLDHHRQIGVDTFLIVDNASDDGSREYLLEQPDVSLWTTDKSYRNSRFGMDWLTGLQMRYAHGRWCLTLDADEALCYPHMDSKSLHDLTGWLDAKEVPVFAAMMLDMYPKGRLTETQYKPGQPFQEALPYYDAGNYTYEYQHYHRNISIRGGVRKRVFFSETPDLAPHLHKSPLVKWSRRYSYLSSTHTLLPRRLNQGFDARLGLPTGILAHSKFLGEVVEKSAQERARKEHFTHPSTYDSYYSGLIDDPVLYGEASQGYRGWQGFVEDGLMTMGDWGAI